MDYMELPRDDKWSKTIVRISGLHRGNSLFMCQGLPRWLSGKEFACNARDSGSIPGKIP